MPVRDTRTLRPIIAWRLGRYAPEADAPLRHVLAAHPFTLLAEEGRVSVSGLGGKLWSLGDSFARFAGAAEEVRRADAAGASASARPALGFAELLAGDVEAM